MPRNVEIRIRGHAPGACGRAARPDATTVEPADTILRGPLADRPALLGVLDRLRCNGLELIDVRRLPDREDDAVVSLGASLFLIAVGAILRFAVTATLAGIDIQVVGHDPDGHRRHRLRDLAVVHPSRARNRAAEVLRRSDGAPSTAARTVGWKRSARCALVERVSGPAT